MTIVEINDKDEKRDKTTYFVVEVSEPNFVWKAIKNTWKIKDYDVAMLKENLDKINSIRYIYDCTNPSKKITEYGF